MGTAVGQVGDILRPAERFHTWVAKITAKTLVIMGEGDKLTPVDLGAELAKALPNGHLHIISGASHQVITNIVCLLDYCYHYICTVLGGHTSHKTDIIMHCQICSLSQRSCKGEWDSLTLQASTCPDMWACHPMLRRNCFLVSDKRGASTTQEQLIKRTN